MRWQLPGLCPGQDDLALLGRRQTLLARFQVSSLGEVQIRHPPEVAPSVLVLVAGALERARAAAAELVDWTASAQPPPVVLYRSDEQLRGVACVNQSAVGYYDGAIHVSVDPSDSQLPFEALVTAFPHTADEPFAVATYYQSYMMVEFLRQQRGADVFRGLARELAAGTLPPERAFQLASGLPPGKLETAFAAFLRSRS